MLEADFGQAEHVLQSTIKDIFSCTAIDILGIVEQRGSWRDANSAMYSSKLIYERKSQDYQYSMLKPQKITQYQRQLTEVRNIPFHRPYNVTSIEVALRERIEHSVVERAVVAFGQEAIDFMTRFFEVRTVLVSIPVSRPQTKEDR